jgi:hypothetical protein
MARRMIEGGLQTDRQFERRFTEQRSKASGEQTCQHARKHAAQQQRAGHDARSVAGKAEKMAPVVHELMHVVAREYCHRALLGADEVDQQERQKTAEHGPRQQFAQRDRCGGNYRGKSDIRHDRFSCRGA